MARKIDRKWWGVAGIAVVFVAGVIVGSYGDSAVQGQSVGDIQEGTQPFQPSRIQWLTMEANSMDSPTYLEPGHMLLTNYVATGANTITAYISYTEGAPPQNIREYQLGTHDYIVSLAESYDWDDWVEVEISRSEIPLETQE